MRPTLVSGIVIGLSFAYAAARYVILGDVSADQLPAFILNKALSFAGLALIALAVGARPIASAIPWAQWLRTDRRALGMTGLGLSAVHTVLSLMLLRPVYFAKFYVHDSGMMTGLAEGAMLAGTVALVFLIWQSRITASASDPSQQREAAVMRRRLGTIVLALTLLHVALMGGPGWLAPSTWPGALPPITLVSAVVAACGVVLGLLPRRAA